MVSPKPIPPLTIDQQERFWSCVEVPYQPSSCWEYRGHKTKEGYHQFWFDGVTRVAHRVSYTLLVGEIPLDKQIDHLCRNPGCVNPDHLQIVDERTNILRGHNIAAKMARRTHCAHGHPLSGHNLINRPSGRSCRECARIRSYNNFLIRKLGAQKT